MDPTPMSPGSLQNCQYGAWYESYMQLAPASIIIPLSEEFSTYLVQVRESSQHLAAQMQAKGHCRGPTWLH